MIYTVTLNPSIDYYVSVEGSVYDNEVNRASSELLVPAGKGINISKTLNSFKINNIAIMLVGGFTGDYIFIKMQEYSYINVKKINVDGNSRINIKVNDSISKFAVNAIGPQANENCEEDLLNCLNDVQENDYIIISGSMMPGIEFSTLLKISSLIQERNAKLVVDMASLSVEKLKVLKPYLIKPNIEELYTITKQKDITSSIELLKDNNVKNILLSKGKDGFSYYTLDEHYEVNVEEVNAINNVGCGDNLLAGFIASIAHGNSVKEALKFAGACASASVCLFRDINLDDVVKYVKGIKVKYVCKD